MQEGKYLVKVGAWVVDFCSGNQSKYEKRKLNNLFLQVSIDCNMIMSNISAT